MKRATSITIGDMQVEYISIHALVKRATYGRKWYYRLIDISIHALVKRATLMRALLK